MSDGDGECIEVTINSDNGILSVKQCSKLEEVDDDKKDSIKEKYKKLLDHLKTTNISDAEMNHIKEFSQKCCAMHNKLSIDENKDNYKSSFLPSAIFILCLGKIAFKKTNTKKFELDNSVRKGIIYDAILLGSLYGVTKNDKKVYGLAEAVSTIEPIDYYAYQYAYTSEIEAIKTNVISTAPADIPIPTTPSSTLNINCKQARVEQTDNNTSRVFIRDCPKKDKIKVDNYLLGLSKYNKKTRGKLEEEKFKPFKELYSSFSEEEISEDVYKYQFNLISTIGSGTSDNAISRLMYDGWVMGMGGVSEIEDFDSLTNDEREKLLAPYIAYKFVGTPAPAKKKGFFGGGNLNKSQILLKYQK